MHLKKIRLKKQWINCCGEGKLNNEEVSGNLEKGSPKYENERANKVKNEVKLDIDAMKHLKECCDRDDIDPYEKKKTVYVTCNRPFAWKKCL